MNVAGVGRSSRYVSSRSLESASSILPSKSGYIRNGLASWRIPPILNPRKLGIGLCEHAHRASYEKAQAGNCLGFYAFWKGQMTLDFVEADLIAPGIVELRRARRGVICRRRRLFQRPAVLEIGRDPARSSTPARAATNGVCSPTRTTVWWANAPPRLRSVAATRRIRWAPPSSPPPRSRTAPSSKTCRKPPGIATHARPSSATAVGIIRKTRRDFFAA
jgi:hypothetical protein